MMRKGIFFMMICSVLLHSGCGFKDIDKRFFVVTIGIDTPKEGEKKYKVLLKLALPSAEKKGGSNDFLLITEESDSITDAIRLMKSRVDREIDFGHAKAIIFGESVFQKEIHQEVDWLLRRRDIQKIAWVGVGRPTAEAVLNVKPPSENIPSNAIFLSFGQTGSESPYTLSTYLFELFRDLESDGISPILPLIEVKNELLEMNQAVVYQKDQIGLVLGKNETKTYNSLRNDFDKVQVKVKTEEHHFVVGAEAFHNRFNVQTSNKGVVIQFHVRLEGIIEESREDISEKKLREYSKETAKAFKKDVEQLLTKLQEADVDPFGFGLRYRGTHFEDQEVEINRWQELYPEAVFQIKVDVDIKGTGVIE
ncbi:Ger(x)C family spore germination protein [Cytobacillus spongiae]|uniref:Ger(x)C family spore germination protein n=1 Tax=Cytobacillus spongiae TaxID=2901381 RepID=UPI001F468686|nr:Ger(x)C family spore germination protein [Cytobacillus spongiae]UII57108.1 Ger(x)C family spore germination protein [Cytobacillus spongiae]